MRNLLDVGQVVSSSLYAAPPLRCIFIEIETLNLALLGSQPKHCKDPYSISLFFFFIFSISFCFGIIVFFVFVSLMSLKLIYF